MIPDDRLEDLLHRLADQDPVAPQGFEIIRDRLERARQRRRARLRIYVAGAVAVALIMSPAAYHRQAGPREVTDAFIRVSTRLLLWSMWPLSMGICLDFYLISRIILNTVVAPLVAAVLFGVFVILWFVLPRIRS